MSRLDKAFVLLSGALVAVLLGALLGWAMGMVVVNVWEGVGL